jgi:ubiquitin-protein ligase E3 B
VDDSSQPSFFQNILLKPLWTLLQNLGPMCGLKTFIEHLAVNPKGTSPEFQLLTLFSDCMVYLLTLLDDVEMYEKQTPFALSTYVTLSVFLNNFLYRAIW